MGFTMPSKATQPATLLEYVKLSAVVIVIFVIESDLRGEV